jgi:hypothetical protein
MANFNGACQLAYDYFAKDNYFGLSAATDLGDEWIFSGYCPKLKYGVLYPISISKKTGAIKCFEFWKPKRLSQLEKGKTLEIPEEFRPTTN